MLFERLQSALASLNRRKEDLLKSLVDRPATTFEEYRERVAAYNELDAALSKLISSINDNDDED